MGESKSTDNLERLAKEELLREAKRGAERSSTMGTQGWLKPKIPSTNKEFLYRTLKSSSIGIRQKKSDTNGIQLRGRSATSPSRSIDNEISHDFNDRRKRKPKDTMAKNDETLVREDSSSGMKRRKDK